MFITYNSFSPLIRIHVLATSLSLGATEDKPVRSGQVKFSTGLEIETKIRLKKEIVRRRLARLSDSRDCREGSPLIQC